MVASLRCSAARLSRPPRLCSPLPAAQVTDLLLNMVAKAAAQDQEFLLDLTALQASVLPVPCLRLVVAGC